MVTEREAGAPWRPKDSAAAPSSRPGLYLHFPFCSAICPYCDFSVLTGRIEDRRNFVANLKTEIRLAAEEPWPGIASAPEQPFDTVYLGGGTPSILDPEDLEDLLFELRALSVDPEAWIYLEANPEDITRDRVAAWRQLGVRILSLGVQSFDPENLSFLGRRHDPAQARRAIELTRGAGFHTVSLDLIYGLPHQTEADWRRDLEAALEFAPDHLSCYQLTVHEGTTFGFRKRRGDLSELPEESQADLFRLTHELLNDSGLRGYEVSNFAVDRDHQSRHNWKHWRHVPYLGLGPSAHSFGGGRRWWNVHNIRQYQALLARGLRPIDGGEELSPDLVRLERLMLGLSTYEGVDLDALSIPEGGEPWTVNQQLLEQFCHDGLLVVEGRRLRPTLAGLAVANGLATALSRSEAIPALA